MEDRRFLRAAEVSAILGKTTGRIYQMLWAGEIPSARAGRTILIPAVEFQDWLARNKQPLSQQGEDHAADR